MYRFVGLSFNQRNMTQIFLTQQESQQVKANYWMAELKKLPYSFKSVRTSLSDPTPTAFWVYSPSILRSTNVKETLIYSGFRVTEENEQGTAFKITF